MADRPNHAGLEYRGVHRIQGPLLFVEGVRGVGFDEFAEVISPDGRILHGRVLEVRENLAVLEVLEGTAELSIERTCVRFLGRPLQIPVSREMLGRVFDGLGRPLDGGPPPLAEKLREVNGEPINPVRRDYPRDGIQTGISCIDGMNTLVRGQKLPIFSGSGLPHNELAAQIVRQATLPGRGEEFAVVFAAIGVKHDVAGVLPDQLPAERHVPQRGALPHPRRRPERRAPGHAARGAHARRVPRLRPRHARARHPHRYHQLLRGVARGGDRQGRGAEPQGLSGLPVQRPGLASTSAPGASRTGRARSRRFPCSPCRTTTSPTRFRT